MAKGPVEVGQTLNRKDGKLRFIPAIRGILVGDPLDNYADAIREAESAWAQIKADPGIEPVDEAALGIADTNLRLMEALDEASVALLAILHLGAICAAGDRETEGSETFCRDLDANQVKTLDKDLPFLKKALKAFEKDEDEEALTASIRDQALDEGTLGFLVQVAHPVMNYAPDGESASFSWGLCCTAWVYGETLAEASAKAIAWASKRDDKARAEAKKTLIP
jgi:hypothetical protein